MRLASSTFMDQDIRRLIARLVVAVMAADGRITASELDALDRLDGLGLGPLSDLAREELERAIQEPIDVGATCRSLGALDPDAAALLLAALAEIAASDRLLAPRERETFNVVAAHLGVGAAEAGRILDAAMPGPGKPRGAEEPAPAGDPRLEQAYRTLSLEAGAGRARVDAAYLGLVQRYNPAKVIELGPEFAALAVHRLADITAAFETARASLDAPL